MVVENTEISVNNKDVIMIFTRYPIAGRSKTRLIPTLGGVEAAVFQREMTQYTLSQAEKVGAVIHIYHSDGSDEEMKDWLGTKYEYFEQCGASLGDRMANAFEQEFANDAERVIVIGSDCPNNRVSNIAECFARLELQECVIGPALDGGYYMLGMNRFIPEVFDGISWGTCTVLRETMQRLASYSLLPELSDVDEIGDIPEKISVIIPALNEEDCIRRSIISIASGFNTECVLVDGGSTDGTVQVAMEAGGKVVTCSGGRAKQMNYGAEIASGSILLFLHADSELPQEWDIAVRKILLQDSAALGCFGFRVRERIAWVWVVEFLVWIRSNILKIPYGDQALFLKKDEFDKVHGFLNVPILEDLLLVKKFRRAKMIRQVAAKVRTSSRRWEKYGVLKTTLYNQAVLFVAWFGVDLYRLRDAYRNGDNPLWLLFKK